MVARRGRHHTVGFLLGAQGGDLVIGTAQLEGVHRLQVFPLERHVVAESLGEFFQALQGGHPRRLIDGGEQHLA
ncbi:hypothetical protein D3C72_1482970 [compost metagenome]